MCTGGGMTANGTSRSRNQGLFQYPSTHMAVVHQFCQGRNENVLPKPQHFRRVSSQRGEGLLLRRIFSAGSMAPLRHVTAVFPSCSLSMKTWNPGLTPTRIFHLPESAETLRSSAPERPLVPGIHMGIVSCMVHLASSYLCERSRFRGPTLRWNKDRRPLRSSSNHMRSASD